MSATRLEDLDIDPARISTEFSHLDHMYSGRFSEYYYRRFDQALDAAALSAGDTVLEVGGGTGVFLLSLVRAGADVHFTDIPRENAPFSTARELLDMADRHDHEVDYAFADATALPYATDSFDVTFALDVLEHVPNERAAIDELARVTAPNGRAVVSTPLEVGLPVLVREGYRRLDGDRRHTESIRELLAAAAGRPLPDTNDHHRGYDYAQTCDWLEAAFDSVAVEYCPWPRLGSQFNPTTILTATFE